MAYTYIKVGTITVNRPGKNNAMNECVTADYATGLALEKSLQAV